MDNHLKKTDARVGVNQNKLFSGFPIYSVRLDSLLPIKTNVFTI